MKSKISLIIILTTFTVGMSAWFIYRSISQQVRVDLPDAAWEKIFFNEINKVTNLSKYRGIKKNKFGE